MEEEILDIKRENYKLRKENFELIQDNAKLQKEIELLNYRIREQLCKEVSSYRKELQSQTIPKSRVEKAIEQLKSFKGMAMYKKYNYESTIEHMQELLEEENYV